MPAPNSDSGTSEFTITNVGLSPARDRAHRQRAYLISMGVRVLCFLCAIGLPAPMPVRITLIAGAIVLPYIAVVVANAARGHASGPTAGIGSFRAGRAEIDG